MQKLQETPMSTRKKRRFLGPCALEFTAANTGTWRLERPVVDPENCVRCGICAQYCPLGVMVVCKEGDVPLKIDWRYCKGCGICANECPKRCIKLVSERGEV